MTQTQREAIRNVKEFDKFKDQIKITITPEGLRIELLESAAGTSFDVGKPKPKDKWKKLLALLAHELGKLPTRFLLKSTRTQRLMRGPETLAIGTSLLNEPMSPGD
jgi:chemotaxis protein MotB